MALKQYEVDGRTYLLEDKDVPKNAKRVDKPATSAPILPMARRERQKAPKNKAAEAPTNKDGEPTAPTK